MVDIILAIAVFIMGFGFCFPRPPGILGAFIYLWVNRKKIKAEQEKRSKVREIISKLHKSGELHNELRKAEDGNSKYFKRL